MPPGPRLLILERDGARDGARASGHVTPKVRDSFPVGSAPMECRTWASSFSFCCHARCTNLVSVLTVTISAAILWNRSCCSARAANSVAQTKVKSAG